MLQKQKIGVIGLGIMGRNLALNIERNGYSVSIYNRSKEKTDMIISDNPKKMFVPYYSIKEFVLSLDIPRFIFLMITSGAYVDDIIEMLFPYLKVGDILIDGGNSFYKDTIRRNTFLLKKGINFIGMGISGGEIGALEGPALMPGGERDAYEKIKPILKQISARVGNEYCVSYVGPNGSGHYVKMVHNGIEYGDMQLIAEIYFFLKKMFSFTNEQLGKIFYEWNQGELNSYLIEITSHILTKKSEEGYYVLDRILDVAEHKGTGKWSVKEALDLGVPISIIVESVIARYLSQFKNQRVQASQILLKPTYPCYDEKNEKLLIEKSRKALYFSRIILYSQGFYQLQMASHKYNWNLNYAKIAKVFRAGCIIRSSLLYKIVEVYSQTTKDINLLLAPYFVVIANNYQQTLRDVVRFGIKYGIPLPALSAAITYYDTYCSAESSMNLIQAQRDYFGAHTYMRLDSSGVFHTKWVD